jgi:hypothetical protein
MTRKNSLGAAINGALNYAQAGLRKFPHDTIYQHAIKQIAVLRSYLNSAAAQRNADILADFNLGQMAARELGNDEQDFANHLHILQRYVDDVRG